MTGPDEEPESELEGHGEHLLGRDDARIALAPEGLAQAILARSPLAESGQSDVLPRGRQVARRVSFA